MSLRSLESARRSSISSKIISSASAWIRRNFANGPTRAAMRPTMPSGSGGERLIGESPISSIAVRRSRSFSIRGPGVEAEDGAQDDLEGQALHPRLHLRGLAARPALDLADGGLLHQPGEGLHLLAVEGGEHQLALLHVLGLVEQDHRVGADDRLEDPRALAGMQVLGRRGEDLLDVRRVRMHHERRHAEEAEREAVAVEPAGALQEGNRARPPADALQQPGVRRSWWELVAQVTPPR